MARKSHSRGWISYIHPAYYLRRPRRLAFLCVLSVVVLYAVMEHQSQQQEIRSLEQKLEQLVAEKLSKVQGGIGVANAARKELDDTEQPSEEVPAQTILEEEEKKDLHLSEADELALKRRDEIKEAMMHAWGAYETYAWGFDELQPQSKRGTNLFGGLGATVVDSLDTLYIMGLTEQFEKAKGWIKEHMDFNKQYEASVFETTIRVLGGLLSSYDLSGDQLFLDKAKELAERLLPAWNTPSGIPHNVVNLASGWSSNQGWTGGGSTLADFGTESLEFGVLSQRTGDPKYWEKTEKAMRVIEKNFPANGLVPIFVDPNTGGFVSSRVTIGAMGDSFYEYLLKVWVQAGKTESVQWLRNMWDKSMAGMISELVRKSEPNKLAYVAEMQGAALVHKMDHLACFIPGMLVLGASDAGPKEKEYVQLAKELAATCYQFYDRMPSKLSGEHYLFMQGNDFIVGHGYNILRPETVESFFYLWRRTKDPMYREWGWNVFQAFQKHCRTDAGYTGLQEVNRDPPVKDDMMQSFFLAETLKYLYLLFSPDDVIPLDEWVFNTEAHPLRIKRGGSDEKSESSKSKDDETVDIGNRKLVRKKRREAGSGGGTLRGGGTS